jgi:hypothetical protein
VILRTDGERFRPLRPEGDLAAELRLTIRAYRELVAEGVRLTNQLHACLADYYPAAPGLFGELDATISLAFLVRFPTPQDARSAGRGVIVAWLKERGYAHPKRAGQHPPCGSPRTGDGEGAHRRRGRRPGPQSPDGGIGRAATSRRRRQAGARQGVGGTAGAASGFPRGRCGLFLGLPGAGVVTAAALLGELGEDRDALPSARALQAAPTPADTVLAVKKRALFLGAAAADGGGQTFAAW